MGERGGGGSMGIRKHYVEKGDDEEVKKEGADTMVSLEQGGSEL